MCENFAEYDEMKFNKKRVWLQFYDDLCVVVVRACSLMVTCSICDKSLYLSLESGVRKLFADTNGELE